MSVELVKLERGHVVVTVFVEELFACVAFLLLFGSALETMAAALRSAARTIVSLLRLAAWKTASALRYATLRVSELRYCVS
jgi:hypothetical protein